MKTFTKLFFVVAVLGSQLAGFAVNAGGYLRDANKEGISPIYKGSASDWKQVTERQSALNVSAQNARPTFVVKDNSHTCSKIYASAVSSAFHAYEPSKSNKSFYATVTLASLMAGPEQKVMPSINAYPNPSRGITRLSLTQVGNDNQHYKIKISNTIGKVVAVKELSTLDVDVDMSSLPAGVYFYSLLVNDKMVETKRLILQK
ncbi:T9SS type A sorting domain-containing protein [Pontibacter beigongshangensis]|uniref:T9SS type A sorting domain-containing protein n=1 Tax=Pontibacter beigongshangensis TaxID=2574733 RepID=UPI00164F20C4|nr:T9SS type A sorting domain-containing protein [Pontibacter beigongshangensis]